MTEQELREMEERIRAKVIQEITAKKKSDYAWRKIKSELLNKINSTIKVRRPNFFVDAMANISRQTFEKNTVAAFTDNDLPKVNQMLDELLAVCVKYKQNIA